MVTDRYVVSSKYWESPFHSTPDVSTCVKVVIYETGVFHVFVDCLDGCNHELL